MDEVYKNIPEDEIPWNLGAPPKALRDLVESKILQPCKVLEIGCGFGYSAIYFAKCGFRVAGIDISETAITTARNLAAKNHADCTFQVDDILSSEIEETFDFIFDWSVLHHIFPKNRKQYIENVNRLLNRGGKYLSVSFSEKDKAFGGGGKCRTTPIGTTLYFSSEKEMHELFSPYFNFQEFKTIEIEGKPTPHFAIFALLEKEL